MSNSLPCLSLWQPFASLLFSGHKLHETRGWKLPAKFVGQRIGLHATAKFPKDAMLPEELHALCRDVFGGDYRTALPFGAVLGTLRLTGCWPTEELREFVRDADRIAGDWSDGRFAFGCEEIDPWSPPLQFKGMQGFWRLPVEA